MSPYILEVDRISIEYLSQTCAVDGVSFSVSQGEVLAIVGESGSGKTSVIRAINGALLAGGHIAKGRILYEGTDMASFTEARWRALRGKEIATIFQDVGHFLNPIRSVGSQFREFVLAHQAMEEDLLERKMEQALLEVALPVPKQLLQRYPFELSGGQRQRLGIAMALFFKPKILLADEPTSALDVMTQVQVVEKLGTLAKKYGTSIILVTHHIGVAARLSNQLLVMKEGQVQEYGPTVSCLRNPSSAYTKVLLDAIPRIGGTRYV